MVLHSGDLTSLDPVNIDVFFLITSEGTSFGFFGLGLKCEVSLDELLLSKVSELSNTDSAGLVGLDFIEVRSEDGHSVELNVGISELLIVSELELLPLSNQVLIEISFSRGSRGSKVHGGSKKDSTNDDEQGLRHFLYLFIICMYI